MPTDDIRQDIWDLLKEFRGDEPLKDLFWSKLNYTRVNEPLSRRGWSDTTAGILMDDPLLLAVGGEDDGFHVIYSRMSKRDELRLTEERQIISKLFNDHIYSLFIFSNEQQNRWHFVNVRYDKDERRRRVFRRITIGRSERLRTAAERIAILDLETIPPDPLVIQIAHDKAFDVEEVTNQFFRKYDQVFQRVEELVQGIADEEQKRLFTQRLLNRLLFIAFIEKKGWLKYDGDSDYLNALWSSYQNERRAQDKFYTSRLKQLFFSGLNNPQEVNLTDINRGGFLRQLIGDVPYLNGGLFEEEEDDRNPDIVVPDECFQAMLGDLFNRFNFTVTESTPLDQEVAVDPEMLGKVFEELITRRNEKGSYYTPKVVVSFMCREALKGYLGGYERLVDEHDSSEVKLEEARELLHQLNQVKIVDPACGSGAYLLGMLHEVHTLIQLLDTRAQEYSARDDYQRKLSIIQNNIYGVDIDPFAVNIARLRLWLSLAVEFEGERPEPLPNLDFKIEAGDSLTAPDPSGGDTPALFRELINRYDNLKAEYQLAGTSGEKQRLMEEINHIKEELALWAHPDGSVPGFDWRLEFAEVFSRTEAAGFDIVLANPPYGANIEGRLRDIYFPEGGQSKDTYGIFVARALQLLCPRGQLTFIISDTWRTIKTHHPLRRRLLAQTSVAHVIDLPAWIFKATVNTCILTLTKNTPNIEHTLITADLRSIERGNWDALSSNLTAIAAHGHDLQTTTYARYTYPQSIIDTYHNCSFFIGSPSLYKLISNDELTPLGDIAWVPQGISTGQNKYYVRRFERGEGYAAVDLDNVITNEEMRQLTDDEKYWLGIDPTLHDGRHFIPFDKGGKTETAEGWLPNYWVPTEYYIDWSVDALHRMRTMTIADRKRAEDVNPRPGDEAKLAAALRNPDAWYKPAITFSPTGVYSPTFRIGCSTVFQNTSSNIICESIPVTRLLGILASTWARYVFKVLLNHTVHTQEGDIIEYPLCNMEDERCVQIEHLTNELIEEQKRNAHYNYSQNEQKNIDPLVYNLYSLSDDDIREVELWYCRRYRRLAEVQGLLAEVKEKYAAHLERCDNILDQPPVYWRSHPILKLVAQGEGARLEYKETLAVDAETGEKHPGVLLSALKTIAALLNTDGGTLLIGVSDNSEIKGLDMDYQKCKKQDADGFELKLRDLLKERFRPHPLGNVSVEFAAFDSIEVCKVQVARSDEIVHLDKGDVFVRDGNKTLKLEGPELTRWVQKRTGS